MPLTAAEIEHIAQLARLELPPAEVQAMTAQLGDILSYIAHLNELDTEGIEPTTHTTALTNAFREDEVKPSLSQEEALVNAPRQNCEAFVVPKVI